MITGDTGDVADEYEDKDFHHADDPIPSLDNAGMNQNHLIIIHFSH